MDDNTTNPELESGQDRLTTLEKLVYKHQHLGTDHTQKLNSSAPIKGQATLVSGTVHVVNSQVVTTSKIMLTYAGGVTHSAILIVGINAGSFDISALTPGTGSTDTSADGFVDYVIFV